MAEKEGPVFGEEASSFPSRRRKASVIFIVILIVRRSERVDVARGCCSGIVLDLQQACMSAKIKFVDQME